MPYNTHGSLQIIRCDLCNRKRFGKQFTQFGEVVLEICPSCQKPKKSK
jgi:hypothetical protein